MSRIFEGGHVVVLSTRESVDSLRSTRSRPQSKGTQALGVRHRHDLRRRRELADADNRAYGRGQRERTEGPPKSSRAAPFSSGADRTGRAPAFAKKSNSWRAGDDSFVRGGRIAPDVMSGTTAGPLNGLSTFANARALPVFHWPGVPRGTISLACPRAFMAGPAPAPELQTRGFFPGKPDSVRLYLGWKGLDDRRTIEEL